MLKKATRLEPENPVADPEEATPSLFPDTTDAAPATAEEPENPEDPAPSVGDASQKPPEPIQGPMMVEIGASCPRCGGTKLKSLDLRPVNGGQGYDYHIPTGEFIGRLTHRRRTLCMDCGRRFPVGLVVPMKKRQNFSEALAALETR